MGLKLNNVNTVEVRIVSPACINTFVVRSLFVLCSFNNF